MRLYLKNTFKFFLALICVCFFLFIITWKNLEHPQPNHELVRLTHEAKRTVKNFPIKSLSSRIAKRDENFVSANMMETMIRKVIREELKNFIKNNERGPIPNRTMKIQDQSSLHNPHPENVPVNLNEDNKGTYNHKKGTSRTKKPKNVLMKELHEQTYHKLSDEEIKEYYQLERTSKEKFKNVLDPKKDREILKTLFPDPIEHRDRITDQLRAKLNLAENDIKTIYVSGNSGNTQAKFEEDNCNVKQCLFTKDPSKMANADAIYSESSISRIFLRKYGNKNQVTISFQIESASNSYSLGRRLNWTATYRRDSVLNAPYERFTPFVNITKLPNAPIRNFAKGKTKMVAWFVSNCGAPNGRDILAKEIQKHVPVNIYGNCGTMSCLRTSNRCFEKLRREYKFYLSFENSNCQDYVTEKLFWNAFQNDIVPIVMGAHRNEYKRIAPPNSYIHVDDFESPKQLADYLKYLDKNDDAYNSYFLWKGTGDFINTKFMCRLCTMIHLAPYFPMWYDNGDSWWNGQDTCVNSKQQLNGKVYSSWRGVTEPRNYVKYVYYGYKRL